MTLMTVELVSMHLKQQGAFVSRMLSFANCEFELVSDVMDADMERVYNRSAALWDRLRVEVCAPRDDGVSRQGLVASPRRRDRQRPRSGTSSASRRVPRASDGSVSHQDRSIDLVASPRR